MAEFAEFVDNPLEWTIIVNHSGYYTLVVYYFHWAHAAIFRPSTPLIDVVSEVVLAEIECVITTMLRLSVACSVVVLEE